MRALALVCVLAAVAFAEHQTIELECPREISYRVGVDLDGDGLADLAVFTRTHVWIWRGRRGDAFPTGPDVKMMLPPGTAFFDIGPKYLVARNRIGYFKLALGEEPQRLFYRSGPGLPLRPANILWRGFTRDFDGDGKLDWIDMSLDGYEITYEQHRTRDTVMLPPTLTEEADTAHHAASDRLVARYGLGDWNLGDFNGDGRPDIGISVPGGLHVFTGDEKGRVDPKRTLELKFGLDEDAETQFVDFDGDGRTDLFAVRRKAGRAIILMGTEGKGLQAPTRLHLGVPGEIRKAVVEDLDGDGKPDIALPYIDKPSISMAVRALVQGEVILKVPVFLNRGGRRGIRARADRQISLPVRIRVQTDEAGRIRPGGLVVVEWGGDLDGDGRRDLLVTQKPTRLAVHSGRPGGIVFTEDPTGSLDIPDCSAFSSVYPAATDLNGDKRSDIILFYDGKGRRADRLVLLLSRKK